jgi:hypothetical protein
MLVSPALFSLTDNSFGGCFFVPISYRIHLTCPWSMSGFRRRCISLKVDDHLARRNLFSFFLIARARWILKFEFKTKRTLLRLRVQDSKIQGLDESLEPLLKSPHPILLLSLPESATVGSGRVDRGDAPRLDIGSRGGGTISADVASALAPLSPACASFPTIAPSSKAARVEAPSLHMSHERSGLFETLSRLQ